MKKVCLVLSAFVLFFASCSKDDNNVTPSQSNLPGTYRLTAVTEDGVNIFNNTDASLNTFDACERDDQFKLNADGTTQQIDAGVQCSPPNNNTGSWSLASASSIVLNGIPFVIDSFNGTTLKVSNNLFGAAYVATYVKQ
jgi:hypothetical protein